MIIAFTILIYFVLLHVVSRRAAGAGGRDNRSFFGGRRQSPWPVVAFGMIGASMSGVSFVSVPGMPLQGGMHYLQMCMGFIVGYFVVAFVLLPVYYRLGLSSIYGYLGVRLGRAAHRTGSCVFVLGKLLRAAIGFYLVCSLLQEYVLQEAGVPFVVTVAVMVSLIWLYTRQGGVQALVWTDMVQTLCLIAALTLIAVHVTGELGMRPMQAARAVWESPLSRVMHTDDWSSPLFFWKQFASGAFVVVVMTGLDQGLMQKNLTCKSLADAQKDMCACGFFFLPVNALLLSLGVLLTFLAKQRGMELPQTPDDLLPMFAATGQLGTAVAVLFSVGIVAACAGHTDSALTSLTTTVCIDLFGRPADERLRRRAHAAICAAFGAAVVMLDVMSGGSLIHTVYVLCSYTYGPLLGLFAYGLFTKREVRGKAVPAIAVASPLACWGVSVGSRLLLGYSFGYELLMLNGLLTFAALWLTGRPKKDVYKQKKM